MYDQSLVTWLTSDLGSLIPGKSLQILQAVSKRAFANAISGKLVNNDTLTLPRISISRLSRTINHDRYNANKIRKLGRPNEDTWRTLRQASFPTPVNITYQVDFWTKYEKEMNKYEQLLLSTFSSGYKYLSITPDSVYGKKIYPMFLESGMDNNTNLDPGVTERQIRKTITVRKEAWIFDQQFIAKPIVRRVDYEVRDIDSDELYISGITPPLETIGTGDGVTVTYNVTLNRPPIQEHTIVIRAIVSGTTEVFIDDKNGNILDEDDNTIGTLNYTTGVLSLTFTTAPDDTTSITATYFSDV